MSNYIKQILVALVALITISSGCTIQREETPPPPPPPTTEAKTFGNNDYQQIVENPDEFVGAQGTLYGRVFNVVEGLHIQIFLDLENNNQFVLKTTSSRDLVGGNYVKAEGEFTGLETFTNPFGGQVTAPAMDLKRIEKIDPLDAISFMAPAIKTVEVNETINQQGFAVTLVRVKFTNNHTRLLLRVKNGTSDRVGLFTSDALAQQGSRQFETMPMPDVPGIPSSILPSAEVVGVVFFEPLDIDVGNARFVFEGFSENFDITIEPFVFDVSW